MNPGAATVKGKFRQVSISDLKESGINDLLYRPVCREDPEIQELARSIRKEGLLDPIKITKDSYILSGHRRRVACQMAGLDKVLCEVVPITVDHPDFNKLLREHNRQRVKGCDELIREAVVDATADQREIAENLMMERLKRSRVTVAPMTIIGSKRRAEIKGNRLLLDASIRVVKDLEEFWPVNDRHIHYHLLNDPPLRHRAKPDSIYMNDLKSYKTLTDVLTRGRLSGEIPWECIADETRPMIVWDVYKNISPFLTKQFNQFMKGYARDYMQSQPNHIEIMGEKLGLKGIIRPIASEYCIPYTLGKGYASINPRHEMAERFWKSGKEKLIVFLLSDFDPDGVEIAQSFARSMRDDFGVDIQPYKVALTHELVTSLNLPPGGKAKKGSKNYPKFVKEYGENVFELEAVSPNKLQDILKRYIKLIINVDAFNSELEQEKMEFFELAAYRKKVLEMMKDRRDSRFEN